MSRTNIRETFKRSLEGLPAQREDLAFKRLDDEAVDTLVRERAIVLSGFFTPIVAEGIRNNARAILMRNAPIRVARKVIDRALPATVTGHLPEVLKRRPQADPLGSREFSPGTQHAFGRLQDLNSRLFEKPQITDIYGDTPFGLNRAVINRTQTGAWFPRHQDSQGIRDIGFAIQSAPTLWHVEASLTLPDTPDYTFETKPGDVVVLLQRARDLADDEAFELGRNYGQHDVDGSVVHSGMNLSDQQRFGLNLFAVERDEV